MFKARFQDAQSVLTGLNMGFYAHYLRHISGFLAEKTKIQIPDVLGIHD
jgi:hypothetical protein